MHQREGMRTKMRMQTGKKKVMNDLMFPGKPAGRQQAAVLLTSFLNRVG
jgi:hypothetical protein